MEIEEGEIRRGLHNSSTNSVIVLLFIQNNPLFKNKLKHAYLHRY